ncbi:MAG TPA: S9 family peptidase, partial [Pseudoxanthomonas mexicana]|nr:S9 family peptidase [Pseudoxanthomonas mexicana]
MKTRICASLLAVFSCLVVNAHAALATEALDLEAFVRRDAFTDIKLSPDGEFLAATVPREDRTGRVISAASLGKNNHVADFWWVNPERVMFSVAQKLGALDLPQPTGELYAMNAGGSKKENLLGYRVENEGPDTRIQPKKAEAVAGFLVDTLPDDDRNVVVMVRPFGELSYTRAEKMDVY